MTEVSASELLLVRDMEGKYFYQGKHGAVFNINPDPMIAPKSMSLAILD